MRRAIMYARLQFKRTMRYAPFIFLITFILCLCLGLAFLMLNKANVSDENNKKIRVGIVGDMSESYLGFGLSALQSFDSSRFSLEIVEMDETTAREELKAGELAGFVIIPEGFVEEAVRGNVGRLNFVCVESTVDIIMIFKQEVLDLISRLVVESQNGVYGAQKIVIDYDLETVDVWDVTNSLMAEYVMLIFNRSNAAKVEIIGVSDNLSFEGYMFSGITVLLLLLCGIFCCSLFIKRDMAFPKLMNANRCMPWVQVLGEYSAFLAMMLVNVAVLSLGLIFGAREVLSFIDELEGIGVMEMLGVIIKFIPAIVAITALQFVLYELSSSVVSGVLLQFVCAMGLAYVSGCFYPISFFPKSIQMLSAVTPSGIARSYLSALISGESLLVEPLVLILYSFALLFAAVAIRSYRIKRD